VNAKEALLEGAATAAPRTARRSDASRPRQLRPRERGGLRPSTAAGSASGRGRSRARGGAAEALGHRAVPAHRAVRREHVHHPLGGRRSSRRSHRPSRGARACGRATTPAPNARAQTRTSCLGTIGEDVAQEAGVGCALDLAEALLAAVALLRPARARVEPSCGRPGPAVNAACFASTRPRPSPGSPGRRRRACRGSAARRRRAAGRTGRALRGRRGRRRRRGAGQAWTASLVRIYASAQSQEWCI